MSRPNPKKLPTQSSPGGPLFQAFGDLSLGNLSDLPPGPDLPTPSEAKKIPPGRVVISKETAHRGGKTVLVIAGFDERHSDETLALLSKKLRNACGCGGTVRERRIEIQGKNLELLRRLLKEEGYQVAGITAL